MTSGMDGSLNGNQAFVLGWFSRSNLRRAPKAGFLVETILILIDQGDQILAGNNPPIWQFLLTNLVPYLVSSFADVLANEDA